MTHAVNEFLPVAGVPSAAIDVRSFRPVDATVIAALVRQVFDEQVAPGFEPEGVVGMHAHVTPEAIAERAKTHTTLVAWQGAEPVGVIEVRDRSHISMLFVRTDHTGLGIGRTLVACAEDGCRSSGCSQMTVNSSLNAQGFYGRLGFTPASQPQKAHGFVFIPMVKQMASDWDGQVPR